MLRRRALAPLLSVCVLLATVGIVPAAYADTTFALSWSVTASNQPVVAATIEIVDSTTSAVLYTAETNIAGNYTISDIAVGTYAVTATPTANSGYQPTTIAASCGSSVVGQ
jgi:Carboxypeptidase regulatory-like domain